MELWTINKLIKWTGLRLVIDADFKKNSNPIKIYFKFWGWKK